MDYDVVGEQICLEIQRLIELNRLRVYNGYVMRAIYSSLKPDAIRDALLDMKSTPDKRMALSADAREEIDLRIGLSFSSYLSKHLRNNLPELYKKQNDYYSYGPCKFPAFWFCYERALEVEKFEKVSYWRLSAKVKTKDGDIMTLKFKDKFSGSLKEVTEDLKSILKSEFLKVEKVSTKNMTILKPKPMSTIELLSSASKMLGISSFETLKTAEKLYHSGLCSYPRTGGDSYEEDFDEDGHLSLLMEQEGYEELAEDLIEHSNVKRVSDTIMAHPPITPMPMNSYMRGIFQKAANKEPKKDHRNRINKEDEVEEEKKKEIISKEVQLHDLIVKYFLATLSEDAQVTEISTMYSIKSHKFEVTHSIFAEKGFCKYLDLDEATKKKMNFEGESLKIGSICEIIDISLQKWETAPEQYISEVELIQSMKDNGIGTDGTIPKHIKKICDMKYVELVKGEYTNRFIPTRLGVALAEGFLQIDEELIKPGVRKFIEESYKQISDNEKEYNDVISETIDTFDEKLDVFLENVSKVSDKLKGLRSLKEDFTTADKNLYDLDKQREVDGGDYLLEESTMAATDDERSD